MTKDASIAQQPQSPRESGVAQLTLRLLGGFRAERVDTGPLPERWRRPGARTVVKLLALAPGHRLHRDQVTDACWPDAAAETARRSLRVSLHAARHTLEPELPPRGRSGYLATEGDLLVLVPGAVRVDVVEAEQAAAAALATGAPEALAASWETLSRELLPEDRYAEWAADRRRELAALRRRIAAALADAHTAAGQPADAADLLERAVAVDEVDERLHRRLIAACLAMGDRTRAVDHYRRLQRRLDEELGTAPDPRTQELLHRVLRVPTGRSAPRPDPVLPAAVLRAATGPLRGRDQTLDAALARLAPSRRAAVPLTVVSGESGIGKTRLVAEVARAAADRGMTVLWGAAHEAEGPLPYGPVGDALSGWLAGREPAEQAQVTAAHPRIGALLPELGGPAPEPSGRGTAEEERARLFRAVGALLAELSAERPVLLVVDDLHAADLGTVRLLHHLVRTVGDRPLRFLATLREEGLDDGDERLAVLRAAGRQGLLHRIELMRLARGDCDLLAGDVVANRHETPERGEGTNGLDADQLDIVYRLSHGNPLFVTELVRAVAASGAPSATDRTGLPGFRDGLPESVREVVAARVAYFAPQVRLALDVLAAAGGEAALSEAAEAAAAGLHPPLPGPVFTAAVDALTAARLVDECEVVHAGRRRPGLAFRHPVVGLAVYERLTAARRRQLHLAHASAIRRHRPDAVEALAHHYARADDPEATVWLRRAAERAASLYADDSASGYYAELVERLDAAADAPGARAEAALTRLDWAEVLVRLARHEEAEQALRSAIDTLGRSGEVDGAARTAALLADTLARVGRPHEGIALLQGAGRPLPGAGPAAVGAHHLALATLWFHLGRYEQALAHAELAIRAVGEAAGAPLERIRGRGLHVRAACLLFTGRRAAARAAAEQSLVRAEHAGDLSLQCRVLSTLRELSASNGRLREAAVYARRTLELAERTGEPVAIAFERANLARVDLMTGRLAEARAAARSAVTAARPYGSTWALPYCLIVLGEVELRAGRTAEAGRWLGEGTEVARSLGDDQAERAARVLRGELHLRCGCPERALAELGPEAPGESAAEPSAAGVSGFASTVMAEALLATGRRADAERLARHALRQARATGDRPSQVEARRTLGLALLASGDAHQAGVQMRAALRLARAMGLGPAEERIRRDAPDSGVHS
ncbi:ATP-binding protein [Streptomyces venezuelae]|uniref:ATP-binding protein n=1 Tax=Streptomyces venezuelae TaxID=54571 RepID=UPI00364380CA